MTDAEICKANGWTVNTVLAADEGYGITVIKITAIGEEIVLAKTLSHNGVDVIPKEYVWTLKFRDWKE